LTKLGHRLVISAGNNARRWSQYKHAFQPKGVDVFLTKEQAIRELSFR